VSLKIVSFFVLLSGVHLSYAQAGIAPSQLSDKPTRSSPEAKLSVSLTVMGSITVFFGPDGEQTLVMANVPKNEMRQMLADFEERETPHPGKELHSRKGHPDVPGKAKSRGKE
jgi:hypothetical protein